MQGNNGQSVTLQYDGNGNVLTRTDAANHVASWVYDEQDRPTSMTAPMQKALERVRAGEEDPACAECDGILKSATILFGEGLTPGVMERAMEVAMEADLLIAVGTSLQVYPVAGVVPAAKAAGARLLIVNAEPTPFDDEADAVLHKPIGETLPLLVGYISGGG